MIDKIEMYAHLNHIPIMEQDGINFLTNYIKENDVQSILEIGSAIGYSAIKFCLASKNVVVTTIERDINRYNIAVQNIHKFGLENRIEIINDDAFNVNILKKYDLIFIDAAKAQYIKFFEKFKNNLNSKGVIVSDNLKFHGLVDGNDENLSKNVKGLVRKLRNYISFLENNEEFETVFYNIGDGVGISKRK